MDKSNTKCERKEVTGGNDGGGRFIRENQSRSEEDCQIPRTGNGQKASCSYTRFSDRLWIFSRFYGKVDIDSSKDVCDDTKANGKKAVWSKRRVKNLPVQPDGGIKSFI